MNGKTISQLRPASRGSGARHNALARPIALIAVILAALAGISFAASAPSDIGWNFTDLNGSFDTGTATNFTVGDMSIANSWGTVSTPIAATSVSSGYTGATGGGNIGNAVHNEAFSTSTSPYYAVTITPAAGFSLQVTKFDFGMRSTATGATAYALYSSVDSYATALYTGSNTANSVWTLKTNSAFTLNGLPNTPVTLRLYTYGGGSTAGSGVINTRIDDIVASIEAIASGDTSPVLSIDNVTQTEGNAGTTTFTFTVSLTSPAGPSGVTFDIATADGTAVQPGDYVQKSLVGQTITAGNTSYTFDVLVNGDTASEANETFFVNVSNVVGATTADVQGLGTITNDDISTVFIHDVQGAGAATPMPGATVTVEGIVTADFQGSNQLKGFFLQEEDPDADANPATSEGLFVFCNACGTAVAEGQKVRATGVISEFNNLTEITASAAGSVVVIDAGNNLALVTPATIDLPIVGDIDTFYEAREGMKVTFVDQLTVSEYFELARYGQVILYEGGRPQQFTEANAPSVGGLTTHLDNLARREVILDDDNNGQEAFLFQPDGQQAIYYPQANGGFSVGTQGLDFFRGGDLVNGLTGVLHWSYPGFGTETWRIRPTAANPVTFTPANLRPATPPSVGGAIKVAGMNLLNYFTTIDTTSSNSTGPCGPGGGLDCRGADSDAELDRQRERASIVICALNADVFGFMELENTTPLASITDLLGAVNALCGGAHPYVPVDTGGTLGTDAIRVQQIYRSGIVAPVGSPLVDLDAVHNRPPTAQTFDVVDATNSAFGQRFTVVANHFKSKGSCPSSGPDSDLGDGQSCFNATRVAQATRLLSWINSTVIPAAGDPDVILLGDFNSYAMEDPVTTILGAGYSDLETTFQGPDAYSYVFDGQLGHLDYAFASASLGSQVTGAGAWHINADEAAVFDYNDEVVAGGEASFDAKPDGSALVPPRVVFQPGTPYRASDHDPVLVGLFALPPCDPGTFSASGFAPCTEAPKGSFVAGTGATAPTLCPAGTYQDETGGIICKPAAVGSYAAGEGNVAAQACPAGTTTASTNSDSASDCVAIDGPFVTFVSKEIVGNNGQGQGGQASPYDDGWTNRNIRITLLCSDDGGHRSPFLVTTTVTQETDTEHFMTNADCRAPGGQRAQPIDVGDIHIDKTKPVLSATRTPGGGGWANQDILVAFTCSDPGPVPSGIATDTVGDVLVTTNVDSITSTGSCIDNAGNSANQITVNGLRLDKTAPTCTLRLTRPANPNGTMKGASVKVTADDNNGGSGIANNSIRLVSITASGAGAAESGWDEGTGDTSGNVATVAGTTYTWVYSVRDNAGNTGTCSASMSF